MDSFRKINEYLIGLRKKGENEIKPNVGYIYELIKIMDGLTLSKIPRQKSDEIEEFFTQRRIQPGNEEYSFYAIVRGWIDNRELDEIENRFYVYASPIPNFATELADILDLFKEMAKKKNSLFHQILKISK